MEETMAANKLAERIVNQAVSDADQVRAEGDTQVRDFLSSQGKKRDALIADTASKREAAVKGVLDGARTRALIDGRKATLTRKREAIEKAFALAAQRMGDFTQEES